MVGTGVPFGEEVTFPETVCMTVTQRRIKYFWDLVPSSFGMEGLHLCEEDDCVLLGGDKVLSVVYPGSGMRRVLVDAQQWPKSRL